MTQVFTAGFMAPIAASSGASTQHRMFEELWLARRGGPQALKYELEQSGRIYRHLPTEHTEVQAYLDNDRVRPPLRKGPPSILFPNPPQPVDRQAARDYTENDLVLIPAAMKERLQVYKSRTKRNFRIGSGAAAAAIGGLAFVVGFKVALVALVVAPALARWRSDKKLASSDFTGNPEYEGWIRGDEAPATSVILHVAGQAAFVMDRQAEYHFLTLAAEKLFLNGSHETEESLKDRQRLAAMATVRGSHHAAHYLWLLRQQGHKGPETDLAEWEYNGELLSAALRGDSVADDILNLGVRVSVGFRNSYLQDLDAQNIAIEEYETARVAHRMPE